MQQNMSINTDMQNVNPFENLPAEVVSRIFTFLPYEDLKEARLVCTQWYYASLHPNLMDREILVVNLHNQSTSSKLPLIKSHERDYLHLQLEVPLLGEKSVELDEDFWVKIGSRLKSLRLHGGITRCDLVKILSHCPRIECLSFLQACILSPADQAQMLNYFPVLKKLHCLDIMSPTYFMEVFEEILGSAPDLTSVNLSRIICWGTLYLWVPKVLAYFKKNLDRTFKLGWMFGRREYEMFPEFIFELIHLPNVQLRRFAARHAGDCLHVDRNTWLEELYIRVPFSDASFEWVLNNFSNLKRLTVKNMHTVPSAIRSLSKLKKLEYLSLSYCSEAGELELLEGLCSEVNTTLKTFELVESELSPNFLKEFARTHPSLTHLNLRFCRGVNDEAIQAICKHQVKLESLQIMKSDITDHGLSGMPLSPGEVEGPTIYSIARLSGLRSLDLRYCSIRGEIFDSGLKLPYIRNITIDDTQVSFRTWERIFDENPRIEQLRMGGFCTDEFVKVIAKKLPRLKRFDGRTTKGGIEFLTNLGIARWTRLNFMMYDI